MTSPTFDQPDFGLNVGAQSSTRKSMFQVPSRHGALAQDLEHFERHLSGLNPLAGFAALASMPGIVNAWQTMCRMAENTDACPLGCRTMGGESSRLPLRPLDANAAMCAHRIFGDRPPLLARVLDLSVWWTYLLYRVVSTARHEGTFDSVARSDASFSAAIRPMVARDSRFRRIIFDAPSVKPRDGVADSALSLDLRSSGLSVLPLLLPAGSSDCGAVRGPPLDSCLITFVWPKPG